MNYPTPRPSLPGTVGKGLTEEGVRKIGIVHVLLGLPIAVQVQGIAAGVLRRHPRRLGHVAVVEGIAFNDRNATGNEPVPAFHATVTVFMSQSTAPGVLIQ